MHLKIGPEVFVTMRFQCLNFEDMFKNSQELGINEIFTINCVIDVLKTKNKPLHIFLLWLNHSPIFLLFFSYSANLTLRRNSHRGVLTRHYKPALSRSSPSHRTKNSSFTTSTISYHLYNRSKVRVSYSIIHLIYLSSF